MSICSGAFQLRFPRLSRVHGAFDCESRKGNSICRFGSGNIEVGTIGKCELCKFQRSGRYGRLPKRVPCVMKSSNAGRNHQRQKSVQAIWGTFVRRAKFGTGAPVPHVLRRALLPALLTLATLAIAACTGQCVDSFDCPRDEDVKYTCVDKTCQVRPDDKSTDGGTP